MKKYFLILLLIFVLSCNQTSVDTNYRTGTEGVTLEYVEGFPPTEIDEQDYLPVIMHIENKGAYNTPLNKMGLSYVFDPLYFTGPKNYDFEKNELLHGRSVYYPDGQDLLIENFDFLSNPLVGQRSQPETAFTTQLCYEYSTVFAEEICIDVEQFLRTGRTQTCTSTPVKGTSQGAPIAVTFVDSKNTMIPQTRNIRPSFLVDIKNVGNGVVLGPPQTGNVPCNEQQIPKSQISTVKVEANLLSVPLQCSPEYVRLNDGVGTTKCTVAEEDENNPLLQPQYNFITPIVINVTYIYQDTYDQDITIVKREDGSYYDDSVEEIVKGYLYDSNDNLKYDDYGNPLTLCEYYAENPDKAKYDDIANDMNGNFSCSCSIDECMNLDQDHKCFYGLCPGNIECCDK